MLLMIIIGKKEEETFLFENSVTFVDVDKDSVVVAVVVDFVCLRRLYQN